MSNMNHERLSTKNLIVLSLRRASKCSRRSPSRTNKISHRLLW